MKHHPKSNQGRFSKKQRKASRHMMENRFNRRGSSSVKGEHIPDVKSAGILGMALAAILGRRRSAG